MSRSSFFALASALALSGCWWNSGLSETDSWDEDEDEDSRGSNDDPIEQTPSNFFDPNWWTIEIWGLYDGERLTDFQYYASNSGAVPAFAILRFNDPQWDGDEEECYWVGGVEIQGWTTLTNDQYVAWGFTLTYMDGSCGDFDPDMWVESTPTGVLESLYWTLGFLPPTSELQAQLDRASSESPLSWADRYDDRAFSMQLGFEREQGTWDHFLAGAAYALNTSDGDVVVWDPGGTPHPMDLDGAIAGYVIAAGSLEGLDLSLLGVR